MLDGGTEDDGLLADNTSGNNTLIGGSGNNKLDGGIGDDYLLAGAVTGTNTLLGGDGADFIEVWAGNGASLVTQTVDGGADSGTLIINYSSAGAALSMSLDDTTTAVTITAGTNQVKFNNIENLYILGTAFDETITGGNGNDFLNGDEGNDTLNGGASDDYLICYSLNGSTITMDGGDGNVTCL